MCADGGRGQDLYTDPLNKCMLAATVTGPGVPSGTTLLQSAFPPPPQAGDRPRGSEWAERTPPIRRPPPPSLELKAKFLLLLNTKANRSPPPHSRNTFIALKTAFINKHTWERLS